MPYMYKLAATVIVVEAVASLIKSPKSFRGLIYDLLSLDTDVYEPVFKVGGMKLTNLMCELSEEVKE